MIIGSPSELQTWVDFFEEHVTEHGGPLSMTATFEHEAGPWQLVCSRDEGSYVVAPDGERQDVDVLLREAGA